MPKQNAAASEYDDHFDDEQTDAVTPTPEPRPAHIQLTESEYRTVSLFPDPPQPTRSKLALALERAAEKAKADAARKTAYATHLDEVVFGQDLDARADLIDLTNEIVTAAQNGKGQAGVRVTLRAALADRTEMIRKAEEIFGGRYVAHTDHRTLEALAENICADSAILAEAVRLVCAAAGTVRVDELEPKVVANGRTILVRRFADIGDEESGQDPEVTPSRLLHAALKAAVRFENLRAECKTQADAAAAAQTENERLRKQLRTAEAKLNATSAHYNQLVREAKERGDEATFAPPVVQITDGTHWIKLRPGFKSSLSWAYTVTKDRNEAVAFDTVEQAGAILNQICMTVHRHIHIDILNAMRVVRVVTEDHGVSNGDATPTHYPQWTPFALPGREQNGSDDVPASSSRSYDVSVYADEERAAAKSRKTPAKPSKPTQAPTKPVMAVSKPEKPASGGSTKTPHRPPMPKRPVKPSAPPAKPSRVALSPADRKRAALALSQARAKTKT